MSDGTQGLRQRSARETRASLVLVPPLDSEESGALTLAAREWALENRYMQTYGIPDCAHGLYLMPLCPNVDACCLAAGFDHTQIWVPADFRSERPFILTHPYVSEIPGRILAYAEAHGLKISSDPADGWYHPDALPIRLTVPETGPLWPIEDRATVLLHSQPVRWPGYPPEPGDQDVH